MPNCSESGVNAPCGAAIPEGLASAIAAVRSTGPPLKITFGTLISSLHFGAACSIVTVVGRFSTTPSTPSPCSRISTTVRKKFGSPRFCEAATSRPRSDAEGCLGTAIRTCSPPRSQPRRNVGAACSQPLRLVFPWYEHPATPAYPPPDSSHLRRLPQHATTR